MLAKLRELPGFVTFSMGVLFLALGGGFSLATYILAPGGYFAVAYGAILVGAVQVTWGLFRLILHFFRGSAGREKYHARRGIHVIIRYLLLTASADGELKASEISIIRLWCRVTLGLQISEDEIVRAFKSIDPNGDSITDEISNSCVGIKREFARYAVEGMVAVAISDGDLAAAEGKAIAMASHSFGLSDTEHQESIAAAKRFLNSVSRQASKQS